MEWVSEFSSHHWGMEESAGFYRNPAALTSLKPSELLGELRGLVLAVANAAARLSGALHPGTARAIVEFLRPANTDSPAARI